MVIYLDLVILVNFLTDTLALYITAKTSGQRLSRSRMILAALIGSAYGILCLIPNLSIALNFTFKIAVGLSMIRVAFGKHIAFLRMFILFVILSCTLAGALHMILNSIHVNGISDTVKMLDWKVFFLVGCASCFVLSCMYRNSVKHAIEGQIYCGTIVLGAQHAQLNVLLDTGHTLCDPYTGLPVITVWYRALDSLWTKDEFRVLLNLEALGSAWCAQELHNVSQRKFRLIPYRSVGIESALLLAFRADKVAIGDKVVEKMTVVLSPTSLSDGGGYTALWGGENKENMQNVESNQICTESILSQSGNNSPRKDHVYWWQRHPSATAEKGGRGETSGANG